VSLEGGLLLTRLGVPQLRRGVLTSSEDALAVGWKLKKLSGRC
jgi:hypothetical protein